MARVPFSFSSYNRVAHSKGSAAIGDRQGRARVSAATSEAKAERIESIGRSHSSFYEVLGIGAGATQAEIKAAYRKLARLHHPDSSKREDSGYQFVKVNEAYETLSDLEKRADYDKKHLLRSGRLSNSPFVMTASTLSRMSGGYRGTTSYSSSGYRVQSWETDQCW